MDDLVRRLARGEPSAFEALYDRLAARVHHYLLFRVGSRTDADDLLQETFVRLARNRTRLNGVKNLTSYVFTIACNEASRFLHQRAREGRLRIALTPAIFREGTTDTEQAARENAEWAAVALNRLSDNHREVLELKIYGNLTFREIAEVTGLPQGTVATRYRSALEALRDQMTSEQR